MNRSCFSGVAVKRTSKKSRNTCKELTRASKNVSMYPVYVKEKTIAPVYRSFPYNVFVYFQ